MDINKSLEFFNPANVKQRIHIIGCGSVGSTIAVLLARLGLTKISLYDFDIVASHNIANQQFKNDQIGQLKTNAVRDLILEINPQAKADIKTFDEGWTDKTNLTGYVFLCVDNIELRKKIVEKEKMNPQIKIMFDVRTRLTDAQHYAADWSDKNAVKNLLASMNFSHEEAVTNTPTSACGVTLGVASTVWIICSLTINNFINYINNNDYKKFINIDAFNYDVDAF